MNARFLTRSGRSITLWAAVAVLFVAGVLPLCVMLARSLTGVRNYAGTLANPRTWALFESTAILALLATAFAGLAGVTLGLLLARTDLPIRATLAAALSLPLLFPPYILAVGWSEVLGRGGLLSRLAGPAAGEAASQWLFGLPGTVLVLSTAFLPVILLLTMTSLLAVNPTLEQAGRLSAGWPRVLRSVTIPLAAPGIVLSLVLVFLLAMGEFGAPAFLRVNVFSVVSFTQFTAFHEFGAATAAALPLVAVVLLGLAVEQRVLRDRSFQFGWSDRQVRVRLALGRARIALLLLVTSAALILVVLPLSAVTWRGLSVAALGQALERAGGSAARSLVYSGVSATVLAPLGFFLAYLIHRRSLICWRWVDAVMLFLFTLPGTVIGVGLILLWNRPGTNWIYSTPAILVIGFVAQYAVLSARTIHAGFAQTSRSFEDAAEIAGAGWIRRVWEILAPLVSPSILMGWTVSFLFCLRDLSLPLLLAPPGLDTLTARTMTLMANGSSELIAALCLLSVGLAAVPLIVYGLVGKLWSRAE